MATLRNESADDQHFIIAFTTMATTAAAASPADEPTGGQRHRPFPFCRSLDDFTKQEKLGEGTFGLAQRLYLLVMLAHLESREVHKCKDNKTGEQLALKKVLLKREQEGVCAALSFVVDFLLTVFHLLLHLTNQFPLTALREIKIMKLLNHRNVMHLKEVVNASSSYRRSSFSC